MTDLQDAPSPPRLNPTQRDAPPTPSAPTTPTAKITRHVLYSDRIARNISAGRRGRRSSFPEIDFVRAHPRRIHNIDDAVVTRSNPSPPRGTFDSVRCARLYNYIVACGYAYLRGQHVTQADSLRARARPSYLDQYLDTGSMSPSTLGKLLEDDLYDFFSIILYPNTEEFSPLFMWADTLVEPTRLIHNDFKQYFKRLASSKDKKPNKAPEGAPLTSKPRFLLLFPMVYGEGRKDNLGVVFHTRTRRVACIQSTDDIDLYGPVDKFPHFWIPLELLLSRWVNLIRRGRLYLTTVKKKPVWNMKPFCWYDIHRAVNSFAKLVKTIEERMVPEDLLPATDRLLLTEAQMDAAGVPKNCYVRCVLSLLRTPRFERIAPGLLVPHDAKAWAARQHYTRMNVLPPIHGINRIIPPVLIFADCDDRRVDFNPDHSCEDLNPFLPELRISKDNNSIVAGLYSASVRRTDRYMYEEGFRLLLPYSLAVEYGGARNSDGSYVTVGTFSGLFQHGRYPTGDPHRQQSLYRLFDHWRRMIVTGVWTVGPKGVNGDMDTYREADQGKWEEYMLDMDLDV